MIEYAFAPGAVRLLRVEPGEDLIGALTEFAMERNIRAASLSFLGAVRRASLRYYDQEAQDYRDFTIDSHLELVSGVGNISILEGKPYIHAHAAFANAEGTALGGHINEGTEVFAIEATVFELDGLAPVRELDETTGLMLWGPGAE